MVYNIVATFSLLVYIIFGNGILIFSNLTIRQYFIRFLIGYTSQSLAFFTDELCRKLDVYERDQGRGVFFVIVYFVIMLYCVEQIIRYRQI